MVHVLGCYLTLLSFLSFCMTSRILLVVHYPFRSHCILGESLVRFLLEAGHEVTYIAPYAMESQHQSLKQIQVEKNNTLDSYLNLKSYLEEGRDLRSYWHIFSSSLNSTSTVLANKQVQSLMADPSQRFDLVIAEWMFNEVLCGFSSVFNCPYVWYFSYEQYHEILRLTGGIVSSSHTPNMRTNNIPPFTFKQRLEELLYQLTTTYRRIYLSSRIEEDIYEKFFGPVLERKGRVLPPYEDARLNASLVFSNSHFALIEKYSVPPNYKGIGGIHIAKNPTPMTEELLQLMESNNNGVILFSLGTHLKARDLPLEVRKNMMTSFREMNYTILWRLDQELPDSPPNVHYMSWIPQQSVLAHPNCILFISHGGLLSVTESVHFAVPLIGIPVYGDQYMNTKIAAKNGIARTIPLSLNLASDLKEAIEDVLGNPQYKNNVKKLSSVYHDRLISPAEEFVFWVEHVMKTRDASFVRSTFDVPWYQVAPIDIIGFLLVVLITVIYITVHLVLWIRSKAVEIYCFTMIRFSNLKVAKD